MKTFIDYGIDTGNKMGVEVKTTCPQCSQHRKKRNYPCLNVNTDKGVWNCWHCGWSGTLKGGEWQKPEVKKAYTKPDYVAKSEGIPSDIETWFEARGIPSSVLKRNQIGKGTAYFPQIEEERGCILFPYFRGSEVVNIKFRTKDKLFRMSAGAERVLYGLNDIEPAALIWVEGEIDKLSVEVAGFTSCVSVPDGAPAPDSKSYANKFDFMQDPAIEKVQLHIIAVDNDAPGIRLKEELVRRLGRDKCHIVTWPEGCKDANEVLTRHGAAALEDALRGAQPLPIEGTHRAREFLSTMLEHYEHGAPKGVSTGWHDMDPLYNVMPGEWTLVTGIPGHGKSEWLDALCTNLARRLGWTFAMFSPENQPLEYHAEKLLEKYVGKPFGNGPSERMTAGELDAAATWLDSHFTFVLPELPTVESLLETARSLVRRHGISGFVIDPWNEIDHSRASQISETEHISQSLSKIRQFARDYKVHVWLVAHPTKLQKDKITGAYPVPTPYDVSGSAHWRNKADNCISVYRDVQSQDGIVQVHVQKVRKKTNGRVGVLELRYNHIVGQYSCLQPAYYPKIERKRKEAA